jgi:hypothetical protein
MAVFLMRKKSQPKCVGHEKKYAKISESEIFKGIFMNTVNCEIFAALKVGELVCF